MWNWWMTSYKCILSPKWNWRRRRKLIKIKTWQENWGTCPSCLQSLRHRLNPHAQTFFTNRYLWTFLFEVLSWLVVLYFFLPDAPGFTKHPVNTVKIERETAIFNCTVDGNPEPSIDWTKDNFILDITADPDLNQTKSEKVHFLTIENVHRSDEGQYRCVANNSIGSATSEAGSLSVHCKYHFLHRQ